MKHRYCIDIYKFIPQILKKIVNMKYECNKRHIFVTLQHIILEHFKYNFIKKNSDSLVKHCNTNISSYNQFSSLHLY